MSAGHEHLHDDLAAYALGALEAPEAQALENHLAGCSSCSERLRWLTPAIDLLPVAVAQRTPPDRVREGLLAIVREEAQTAALESGAPQRLGVEERDRSVGPRTSWWRGLQTFTVRPAFGMAALILLVIGLGAGYALRGADTVSTAPPGSTLTKAEPLGSAPRDMVSATLERSEDSATLHVHQLPQLPGDRVYQVWVQRAEVMEPRNVFVLRSDGTAEAAIPGSFENAQAVLVTREPRGGSQKPTTLPLLRAAL